MSPKTDSLDALLLKSVPLILTRFTEGKGFCELVTLTDLVSEASRVSLNDNMVGSALLLMSLDRRRIIPVYFGSGFSMSSFLKRPGIEADLKRNDLLEYCRSLWVEEGRASVSGE